MFKEGDIVELIDVRNWWYGREPKAGDRGVVIWSDEKSVRVNFKTGILAGSTWTPYVKRFRRVRQCVMQ